MLLEAARDCCSISSIQQLASGVLALQAIKDACSIASLKHVDGMPCRLHLQLQKAVFQQQTQDRLSILTRAVQVAFPAEESRD